MIAKIGLPALLVTTGLFSSARVPGVAASVAPTDAPVAAPDTPPPAPIFPPVSPDSNAAAVPLQTASPTPAASPVAVATPVAPIFTPVAQTVKSPAPAIPAVRPTPLVTVAPVVRPAAAVTIAPTVTTAAPVTTAPPVMPAATSAPPHPLATSATLHPRATATPAFPPLIPATEPPAGPLLIGPRGFQALPGDSGVAGGESFVVQKKWVKVVGTHVHVVLLGQTSSKLYSALGDDPKPYIPMVIHGLQGQNKAFNVLDREPVLLCNQKDGYLVRYEDHSSQPLAASVVFAVSGGTLYTAIYEHDLGTPDLPAARLSIATLCPPYDDTDK